MIATGAAGVRGIKLPVLLCTATSTHFTSLNSDWERILGWTRAELMSRPFADFVHPNDRDRTIAAAANLGLPGYELANFENRFRARGGRWHRLRWSAHADGRTWVAVAVDITDEQRPDVWVGPEPSPAPRPAAPSASPGGEAAAQPAAFRPTLGWRGVVPPAVGILAVGLVAIAILLAGRSSGGHALLGAGGSGAARSADVGVLAPHMFGPVNGGGPLYTRRGEERRPPAMLGPRLRVVAPQR
jgi:PAS domain S-box-containing protein